MPDPRDDYPFLFFGCGLGDQDVPRDWKPYPSQEKSRDEFLTKKLSEKQHWTQLIRQAKGERLSKHARLKMAPLVEPEFLNVKLQLPNNQAIQKLSDFDAYYGQLIVSESARAAIEAADDLEHQFVDVDFVDGKGKNIRTDKLFYNLHVRRVIEIDGTDGAARIGAPSVPGRSWRYDLERMEMFLMDRQGLEITGATLDPEKSSGMTEAIRLPIPAGEPLKKMPQVVATLQNDAALRARLSQYPLWKIRNSAKLRQVQTHAMSRSFIDRIRAASLTGLNEFTHPDAQGSKENLYHV